MTNPIQILLLDIGEVVLRLDVSRLLQYSKMKHGSLDQSLEFFNHWDVYQRFEEGKVSPEIFLQALGTGLQVPVEKARELWNSMVAGPVAGIDLILKRVSVPVFALTNSNAIHFDDIQRRFGTWDLFRGVFASHNMGVRKPDAAIYEKVQGELGVPPAALLFIDDREENVLGARAAGYSAERCMKSPDDLEQILLDYGVIAAALVS